MNIKNLPRGEGYPEEFNVVIEIPRGSHNKYEYDEELDIIKIDRVYFSSMFLPADYGFIPQTRSQDGDHLDAIVMLDMPAFPGCLVRVRPIGAVYMIDSGEEDEKIVSVPVDDPRYANVQDLSDLSPHFEKEVRHYFEHYKDLEGKKVVITGFGGKPESLKILQASTEG